MKVQTKIILLLVLVFSTFLAGLWALHAWDRSKIRRIAEDRFNERNRSFETFLRHNSVPFETLVEDYRLLDPLFNAIEKNDRAGCTRISASRG
jgi:sensor domain CHASE-containing protein